MMKLKTKKLHVNVARRIMASLVAGSLAVCTGTFVFAADASNNSKTVNKENYDGGRVQGGYSQDGNASDNELNASNIDVS